MHTLESKGNESLKNGVIINDLLTFSREITCLLRIKCCLADDR